MRYLLGFMFLLSATCWAAKSTPTSAPQPKLVLSRADDKVRRTEVVVWDSYFAKIHCRRAKNLAEEVARSADYHSTSCVDGNCLETTCVGSTCDSVTDRERAARDRELRECQDKILLAPGTAVTLEKEEPGQCSFSMVRVGLDLPNKNGKPATGCVDPDNLAPHPPVDADGDLIRQAK